MATKKVGSSGRFGARYGRKVRAMVASIEAISRAKHACPLCLKRSLSKTSAGIWECKSCGKKFAGGAFSPETSAKKVMRQIGG